MISDIIFAYFNQDNPISKGVLRSHGVLALEKGSNWSQLTGNNSGLRENSSDFLAKNSKIIISNIWNLNSFVVGLDNGVQGLQGDFV